MTGEAGLGGGSVGAKRARTAAAADGTGAARFSEGVALAAVAAGSAWPSSPREWVYSAEVIP